MRRELGFGLVAAGLITGAVSISGNAHATGFSWAHGGPWAGAYVGLHGGYAWQDGFLRYDSGGVPLNFPFDLDNGIIGVQAGYLLQSGRWVFGVEVDYTGPDRDQSVTNDPTGVPEFIDISAEYLASVRGKLGFSTGKVLLFGTVGIGFTEYEFSVFGPGQAPNFQKVSLDEDGVVYGGGVEIALKKRVSVSAEYLHYDVGKTFIIQDDDISGFPDADDGDFLRFDDVDVFRVGVNVRFGPRHEPAPYKTAPLK